MAKLNKNVITALKAIQVSGRVTREVGEPLIKQGLIEVNVEDVNEHGAAARLTQKALESLPVEGATVAPVAGAVAHSSFAIITGAVPPESKKGKGREAGPSKYPFDDLPVNGSFFVAVDAATPNPLKTMGSAVTNATNKYRVDTGKTETKTRTKRGPDHKAVVDANGEKVQETVTVPVYDYPRKFVIRGVKANQVCGQWTAPSDGALITRVK